MAYLRRGKRKAADVQSQETKSNVVPREGEIFRHDTPRPPASIGRSLFTSEGLDQITALFSAMPDPDVVMEKLGLPRTELRKLEGDDEVSQALDTRREAVIAVPWRIETKDKQIKEFIEHELNEWIEVIIRGAWESVPYGYSAIRPVYHRDQGQRIGGIKKIVRLPFEWFVPLRDGRWQYTPEWGPSRFLEDWELEYLYFITTRNTSYRNPYGEALLSRAYFPWFFRHNGWRFWMQFLERFGTPFVLGKSQDPQLMAEKLWSAVQDAVISVGHDDEVELVTSGGRGDAFHLADEALVRRIQRLILGQTASSGDTGGFSKGQMQENVRIDKRNSDLRLVMGTIQRIINSMTWLRFGNEAVPPVFVMEDNQGVETDRAERDSKLVQSGVIELTEQYIERVYDYEPGDFVIPKKEKSKGSPFSKGFELAAGGQRFSQSQQFIEDLADSVMAQSVNPIDEKKLREAVLMSRDPEDLENRLIELYEGEDHREFRDLTERAFYLADVIGYATAEGE